MIRCRAWGRVAWAVGATVALAALSAGSVAGGGEASADGVEIAVTIDDVPWSGGARPRGPALRAATERLLSALSSRGVPAVGFVNCDRVEDLEVLRLWVAAGFELGNHSAAHLDLNRAPLDAWLDDVRRCHRVLRNATGVPVRYFRFPYLHRGPTVERRAAARALLDSLGVQAASVSVDNSEWILAAAYADALERQASERVDSIARLYVEHVVQAVEHFREVARRKVGRDVRHVLLLHANALAVDHLGALLDSLAARGAVFIALEEALADPVYDRADGYVGPKGLSWLYRIAPATPEAVAWDDAQADELARRLGAPE